MKLNIVIAGWYFKNANIYKKLIEEAKSYNNLETKYFIASHKKEKEIDKNFIVYLHQLGWKLLYFKNKGWDWGAYQQFLTWQKNSESLSDYYLFLHDDIKIRHFGSIGVFIKQIQNGAKVVGNGLPYTPPLEKKWTEISPHIFLWAKFKSVSIRSKRWRCVRGSCLFTTKEIVENILIKMPIKNGFHSGFGNWSVKIFGGLLKDLYGEGVIKYLGDEVQKSFYIEEEYRGGSITMSLKKGLIYKIKQNIPFSLKQIIKMVMRGQKAPSPPSGLKLNLGCGNRYLEGYLNIDINNKVADLNADITTLDFKKDSVSEILMVHVIEHIDFFLVEPFLKKIYLWLKGAGQLIIEFPDLIKVARSILRMKNKSKELQDSPMGMRGFYGEPTKNMSFYDYHKWGYSQMTIKLLLKLVGFRKIYIERPQYHGRRNRRDTRIVAIK